MSKGEINDIRVIKISNDKIKEILSEYEDLIVFLHQDSDSELDRVNKRFSKPIAKSMPIISDLLQELQLLEFDFDKIIIEFNFT